MSLSINNNMMASNSARNLNMHYAGLSVSVRRLSSGLRVGQASDDSAGLAIRELMRADITALRQGIRNVNDAISMLQTADGALSIIDEKLIRMKELAEQAATGTYTATQRELINDEFRAMGQEINRIAMATDFNGIKLLDGTLTGMHDGSGLIPTGNVKIHFGAGNDQAEDYYYIQGADATIKGLGLGGVATGIGSIPILSEALPNGNIVAGKSSGIISFSIIPKGSKNVSIMVYDLSQNDSLQVFTRDGKHLVGTTITQNPQNHSSQSDWGGSSNRVYNETDMNNRVITEANAFLGGATYTDVHLNGGAGQVGYIENSPRNQFSYQGMNFDYSGDGNLINQHYEYLEIDEVTEDLVFMVVGQGAFNIRASWDDMPPLDAAAAGGVGVLSIKTQHLAQEALEKVDQAIAMKDAIRADFGAMQNRLENTASNLAIQAENLQAAESRISDIDVATEMTEFVRNQIMTQAAVSMLGQANSVARMALDLMQ